ncbi:uncharacterized protein upSET isoform X2 [Tribolium castaneum]
MSVCLETSSVLANQVSTSTSPPITEEAPIAPQSAPEQTESAPPQPTPVRTIAKLPTANAALSKASLITVLNTPLGNVKTLCVTPAVSSNATGQFTVVNSATPLNVANSTGKPQTITLINTPVTVVKTISPSVEKSAPEVVPNSSNVVATAAATVPALIENRGHNVFVKNTACADNVTVAQDVPQSHKLLTANNFPTNNVLTTAINVSDVQKTANGQRNKVKILSNVLMPGTSQGNVLLNKPLNVPQRYAPRPKLLGANNGATTKYLNKPPNNMVNKQPVNMINKQQPQRVPYPTHKSQIKTLPPVNNYLHGKQPGIKTLPPHKGVPGQIQRTGSGLRTIPPQRPQKIANKPNYIGKHAVQAQKLKQPHKLKSMKANQLYNNYHGPPVQEKQMTFTQALTAEIIETLSNKTGNMTGSYSNKSYESLPPRYENSYYSPEMKPTFSTDQARPMEERTKSGLDLIYQAVLLDHNYNATLPPESPNRSIPTPNTPSQMNGVSGSSMYSPGSGKRRTLSASNPISSSTSLSTLSAVASNSNSVIGLQDDDAASDISDGSDRKQDTEGEETDTAPEAEAVNNEDQFGDYVTRCICGFIHDDGYMIECDRCKVWQHVQCVVKNKQVPEEYLCEVCDPHKHIDRQKARMVQQQWLRERQFADPKLRKDTKLKEVFKHKESLSDSDTSDGEHTGHNNNIVGKGRPTLVNRRKSDSHQKGARQRRDSAKEVVQRRQIKKRERKVVKRKTKAQLKNHSDDENHDSVASTHLPQLRQWIENYEEAVTNHYSPELRARISNIRVNGAHNDISIQFDPSVHKCRVHTQPLTELKFLVSTVHLPPNSPVIELRGKYMLSAQHRNSGSTFNTRQHAQRPGPFLFFYKLHKDNTEVCVDTRTYGNSARFIRRSCKPNAELRHSIVKGVLHLYIVTIANVDKNVELTIKHESHDLAAIGTTHIACACGNPDECTVNRTSIKKNGESTEMHKKRRGRRTTSVSLSSEYETPNKPKKETLPQPLASPPPPPAVVKHEEDDEEDVKPEVVEQPVKTEPEDIKPEVKEEVTEPVPEDVKDVKVKEEEVKPVTPSTPPTPPITTRRSSSHHKAEKEECNKEPEVKEDSSPPIEKNKNKKLSREERKLEAILRAIAQMEKADQRKQEHQAKQAHRRESEPGPGKDEDKAEPKMKRKRRKGRARTSSTHTPASRRNRLNSTDSYLTSGDETLLSPHDSAPPNRPSMKDTEYKENTQGNQQNTSDKDVGLLLALSNGEKTNKSPPRETDSNSNSAQSSPETHLSSACLLVQAAVEPMEQGFKFPKTKKVLMNEWLNKVPEPVHSASSISPSSLTPHINTGTDYESNVGFYNPGKSLVALAQVASFCDTNVQPRGSAKKRWLRQAISEDQCDSPSGRPESPPISETIAPPKKRRLPRESLSNDITPPSTPTSLAPPTSNNERPPVQEGCVEIVYSGPDEDSPSQAIESDAVLEERVAEMKEEFSNCVVPPLQEVPAPTTRPEMPPVSCLMDPRLSRDHHHIFSNSDHLVGTVEKTLSILGFEERKPEPITPAKRKLSITEYRQRKKLNNNDKTSMDEPVSTEENNSSESFKPMRPRSDSMSSSTSITSSDDEAPAIEMTAPSAFNSEPTELERQRELTTLRLKKVLGIAVDEESRKPALDVEAILNCELPPVVKTIPPSPTFPIPGSCDVTLTAAKSSPILEAAPPNPAPVSSSSPPTVENEEPEVESEEIAEEQTEVGVKPNMFYTPDEEEAGVDENAQGSFEEIDSVDYVPPFNNPVYPNDSNFTAFASVLDEEGRYEGRNPSPPPDLEAGSSPYPGQQT